MKTSYSWYIFFFVLGGVGMVAAQNMLFVKAMAQPPATGPAGERQIIVEQLPGGRHVQLVEVRGGAVQVPINTPDGGTVFLAGPVAADPATAKLMQEEMQAAQQAHKLASDFRIADSDSDREKLKAELKEKLTAIFDMQQKRRAHEVAQIEKRLARLKETMSKRDSAKDAIVDRRLNVLTGGIDELGWEDTFRQLGAGSQTAAPQYGAPAIRGGINLPGPTLLPHPDTTDALLPQTPVPATPAPTTRSIPPSTSPVPENPAGPAAEPEALPSSSR